MLRIRHRTSSHQICESDPSATEAEATSQFLKAARALLLGCLYKYSKNASTFSALIDSLIRNASTVSCESAQININNTM